ncbi:hypothetical protein GCM10027037_02650 [Mucilaginibacter koreensis]
MKKYLILIVLLYTAIAGCKKESGTEPGSTAYSIDQTAVTVNYDGQHQFAINSSTGGSSTIAATWSSSDTTVGTINSAGLFKAKRVGTTTVKAAGSNLDLSSTVTVAPYYQLYQEPYRLYNSDTTALKAKEIRTIIGRYRYADLVQVQFLLSYKGENSNLSAVQYNFIDNKETSASLTLTGNNDLTYIAKLMAFYRERYPVYLINSASYQIFKGVDNPKELITVDARILNNISVTYVVTK